MTDLQDFARKCSLWNDDYLLEQFHRGAAVFAHAEYFSAIETEVARRGLASAPPPASPEPASAAPTGPYFNRLWRGEVPLAETYWAWGVTCNVLLALLEAITFRALPEITILLVPFRVTYFAFTLVAIWRSSGRYRGPRIWAELARIAVVLGVLRTLYAVLGWHLRDFAIP